MAYAAPVKTVAQIIPGFGSPSWPAFQSLNVAIGAGATTTTTLPAAGTLTFNNAAVTMSNGYGRCRLTVNGASATVAVLFVGIDATPITTVLAETGTTVTSTNELEYIFPFFSERAFVKFQFAVTTVGAAGTFTADFEVAGNP